MTDEQRKALTAVVSMFCIAFVFVLLSVSLWLADGLAISGKLAAQAAVVILCGWALVAAVRSTS